MEKGYPQTAGPITNAHRMDLSKLFKIKIVTGDDADKFCQEIQILIRDGWQDKGMTQNITWSESSGAFQFGFIGTFIRQGI